MPQMGESIFEGTITKWLKKAGEKVQRDEPLFELVDRIVELDAAVDHFLDQALEPIADHGQSSSRPVRRRNASRYLPCVRSTTSSGSPGAGACLFHWIDSR